MKKLELSIVIPIYKSQNTIEALVKKLFEVLKDILFEIILVNDGSPDESDLVCSKIAKQYKNVTYIQLRKNFGEFNAVFCGLNYVNGQYAIMIDDDFQNPPTEIIKMLQTAQEGQYDVVYAQYIEKKHHFFRNFGSQLINNLNTWLIHKPSDLYLSSFKAISYDLIQEIIKYSAPNVYLDGIIFQLTNNISKVTVEHSARQEGSSNYTSKKLISLFLNAMLGYSTLPMRIILGIGIFIFTAGILLLIFNFFGSTFALNTILILLVGGVIQMSIGICGDYVLKNYQMAMGKPSYVVKRIVKSHDD